MLFSRPIHVLIAMQLISFIQIALSTLAFKNEIAFFKGRTDFAGLSSRSLATDAIQAWVIFFYLLDYEHASRVVGRNADGSYVSTDLAAYPDAMNRLLAEGAARVHIFAKELRDVGIARGR